MQTGEPMSLAGNGREVKYHPKERKASEEWKGGQRSVLKQTGDSRGCQEGQKGPSGKRLSWV